jgi:hypothetical protein
MDSAISRKIGLFLARNSKDGLFLRGAERRLSHTVDDDADRII